MAWEQKPLKGPLMDGLGDLANALGSASAVVESTLGTAVQALDLAKVLYAAATDPFAALFKALLDLAEQMVNDTFGTGVYMLNVDPTEAQQGPTREEVKASLTVLNGIDGYKLTSREKAVEFKWDNFGIPLMTPSQCVSHMVRSLNDKGDTARPQFSNTSQVAAVGIIVTAPDLQGFVSLAQGLLKVIDMADLQRFVDKVQNLSGMYATQKISFSSVPTRGSYQLGYMSDSTDNLTYKTAAGAIATALNKLDSIKNGGLTASATGTYDSGILVKINGSLTPHLLVETSNTLRDATGKPVNITISWDDSIPKRSRKPDWDSWKLNSIELLRQQQVQLLRLISIARGYTVVPDNVVVDLINLIEKKVKTLLKTVEDFNDLIAAIKAALMTSGVYVISIPSGVGGNNYIAAQLNQNNFRKLTKNGYSYGVLIVGGGPSLTQVSLLQTMLGL